MKLSDIGDLIMKKLIILLLTMTTLIFGQETAITTTGKRVTLYEDKTWAYIESKIEEGFDFRKTNWGMSMEEVSKAETATPYGDPSDDVLMFLGNISELDCVIVYFFTNDLLTGGRYFFTEEHSNKNDYISDYENMKELLSKKYGEPTDDEDYWKKDLYKDDYQYRGMAVSMGHYVKYADWEYDVTEIGIVISGENYSINHQINYTSVELKGIKEAAFEGEALDEL
jgi:hypothetical protein